MCIRDRRSVFKPLHNRGLHFGTNRATRSSFGTSSSLDRARDSAFDRAGTRDDFLAARHDSARPANDPPSDHRPHEPVHSPAHSVTPAHELPSATATATATTSTAAQTVHPSSSTRTAAVPLASSAHVANQVDPAWKPTPVRSDDDIHTGAAEQDSPASS